MKNSLNALRSAALILAGVTGVAGALPFFSGGCSAQHQIVLSRLTKEASSGDEQKPEYTFLQEHVARIFDYTIDPQKPKQYIIAQRHSSKGLGLPEEKVQNSLIFSVENQIHIYHTIMGLYKNRGVHVLTLEGRAHDDRNDLDHPSYFRLTHPESYEHTKRELETRCDEFLKEIYLNKGIYPQEIAEWMNEDLFGTGFEQFKENKESADMGVRWYYAKEGQEERRIYAEFREVMRKKSMLCLSRAEENTQALYDAGLVPNQNGVIVIGASHIEDFVLFFTPPILSSLSYSPIIIFPRGLDSSIVSYYTKLHKVVSDK